jgi:hypothetical protein
LPSRSEFAPHLGAIAGIRQKQRTMPIFCLCNLRTLCREPLLLLMESPFSPQPDFTSRHEVPKVDL